MTRGGIFLSALLFSAGCKGDKTAGDTVSSSAPVKVPADLSITVTVNGNVSDPVTAETLRGLAPDFSERNRRAWRLTRVLGDRFQSPHARVEAGSEDGAKLSWKRPISDDDEAPVLLLTRRGQIAATQLMPNKPFPDFHGSGDRDGKPRVDRILPVTSLAVTSRENPHTHPMAPRTEVEYELFVKIDGASPKVVPMALLEALPELPRKTKEGPRWKTWSLRAIAAKLAGDNARVVVVRGADDVRVPITPAQWNNAKRVPVLRASSRGPYEFVWLDRHGAPADAKLEGVTHLEVASR